MLVDVFAKKCPREYRDRSTARRREEGEGEHDRGEFGETPGDCEGVWEEGRAAGGNRAVTSRKTATVDCLVRRSRLAGDVTFVV